MQWPSGLPVKCRDNSLCVSLAARHLLPVCRGRVCVCGVCVGGGAIIVCVCGEGAVIVCVCVWGGCSHSVCIGTLVIIQARTCYSS